jgi:hypothetical protein
MRMHCVRGTTYGSALVKGQEVSDRRDEGTTAEGQVVNSVTMFDRH